MTADDVEARRHALALEDEGLIPVDRIIAAVGGIIGGALTLATLLAYAAARDVLGLRHTTRHP